MPPVPEDKALAERLAGIERSIADLYGALDLRRSTISGGTFQLVSADGSVVASFGRLGIDPLNNPIYGLMLLDSKDDIALMVEENAEGLLYPHEFHQWIVPTPQSISSGTFQNVAECEVVIPSQDTLTASGVVVVPAGSTAECRIIAGGTATNTVTIPAGQATVLFEWIHPFSVGWGDETATIAQFFCQWHVRLASGAGPITAYPPRHLTFRNRRFLRGASVAGGGRTA